MSTVVGLYEWDFKDYEWVADGWDKKRIPTLTQANFIKLLDHYNKLADNHNELTVLVQKLQSKIDRLEEGSL